MAMELVYFALPGRAEAARQAAKVGEVEMADTRVTFAEWPAMKATTKNGQLPFLKVGDIEISQSIPILRLVGGKAGLIPEDPVEDAVGMALMADMEDYGFGPIKPTFKGTAEEKKVARLALIEAEGPIPKFLAKTDALLAASKSGFLVGDKLSIADLDYFSKLCFFFDGPFLDHIGDKGLLDQYVHITAYRNKIATIPAIKAMYEGTDDPMRKCFQPTTVELLYFPIAGRGELIKLIAAAGGVPLTCTDVGMGKHKEVCPDWFGSLPELRQGDFSLVETQAIEGYVANLSANARSLQATAVDAMYGSIKEDFVTLCAKPIFGDKDFSEVGPTIDTKFGVLEKKVPEAGFINGYEYPTAADCALLNIYKADMPMGVAMKGGGYELTGKFPKIEALVERTAAHPGVAAYLASEECTIAKGF